MQVFAVASQKGFEDVARFVVRVDDEDLSNTAGRILLKVGSKMSSRLLKFLSSIHEA